MKEYPTVFHITHPKTGSRWIGSVLKACVGNRHISRKIKGAHCAYYFCEQPIKVGGVYQSVFLPKPEFEMLLGGNRQLDYSQYSKIPESFRVYINNWYNFQLRKERYKKFVIIRDLRDTLTSVYFSFKISHTPVPKNLQRWRKHLNCLDEEQGFIYLLDEVLPRYALIQSSWIETDTLLIKYEDLIGDEHSVFEKIINHCQIEVESQQLHNIIELNSFQTKTGRQRGQENINEHQRKGVAGDWRNHFTPLIKKEFKLRFGDLLIKSGYELNTDW